MIVSLPGNMYLLLLQGTNAMVREKSIWHLNKQQGLESSLVFSGPQLTRTSCRLKRTYRRAAYALWQKTTAGAQSVLSERK